jgi:NAD(P)-dependent dehydrogenase (short-subunit alcohol dehydrogenase family)
MTITFITGANKGLGYETARRLIEIGQTVLIGARDPNRGQTAVDRLGARFVPIDIAQDESVSRAAEDIKAYEGRIDVLINNAGIIGSHLPAEELTPDRVESQPIAPLYTAQGRGYDAHHAVRTRAARD